MATQKKEADVVRTVHLKTIRPSELNPRKTFDKESMRELVESVKLQGVLQPLIVRPTPGGSSDYEIVVGERRYRACVAADIMQVPVIVRELDDEAALEAMLAENLMRENLEPLEEAVAVKRFLDVGMTQVQLAKRIGKSQAWISNRLRMLELPEGLQRMVAEGQIGVEHAMLAAPYSGKPIAKKIEAQFKDKLKMGRGMTVEEAESQVDQAFNVGSLAFDIDDPYAHDAYKQYLDLATCRKCPKTVKRKHWGNKMHTICLEIDCFRPKIHEAKEKAKRAVVTKVENKAKKGKLTLRDMDHGTYGILREERGGRHASFDIGACRKCASRKEVEGHVKGSKVVVCIDRPCYAKKEQAFKDAEERRVQRLKENLVANLDARAPHQGTPLAAAERRLVLFQLLVASQSFMCEEDAVAIALKPWYQKCPGDWSNAALKIPDKDLDEATFRVAAALGMEGLELGSTPDDCILVKLLPGMIRNPKGEAPPAAPTVAAEAVCALHKDAEKRKRGRPRKQLVVDDGTKTIEDDE